MKEVDFIILVVELYIYMIIHDLKACSTHQYSGSYLINISWYSFQEEMLLLKFSQLDHAEFI